MRRSSLVPLSLFGLSLILAGCPEQEEPLEPIKVGLLVPESGSLDFLGGPWKRAANLAKEQINAAGGLYDSRPLELVVRDTRSDDAPSVEAARSVIGEGVVGLIGPARSSGVAATMEQELAASNQIPQISCCATSVDLTANQSNMEGWFFRTTANDSFQARALAFIASRGVKGPHPDYQGEYGGEDIASCGHLVLLHQDDSYGASLAGVLENAYSGTTIYALDDDGNATEVRDGAGNVVTGLLYREEFDANLVNGRSQTDPTLIADTQAIVSPIVASIAAAYDYETNPGVCAVVVGFPDVGAAMFRAVSAQFTAMEEDRRLTDDTFVMTKTYLGTDGLANADFAQSVGTLAPAIVGTTPSHAFNTAYDKFRNAYRARFTEEPIAFTSHVFDAVMLMGLAIAAAGNTEGTDIRDQLFEVSRGGTVFEGRFFGEMASALVGGGDIDYIGPSGLLDFDDKGDVVGDYLIWRPSPIPDTNPVQYEIQDTDFLPAIDFAE